MGTKQRARLAICSLPCFWLAVVAGANLIGTSPWAFALWVVGFALFAVMTWALSGLPSEAPLGFDYLPSPRGWRALADAAGWPSTLVVIALGLCLLGTLAGMAVGFVRFLSA